LGNIQVIRLYPPESGLRLLEDILGRIRSSPQLAINSVQQKQNLRLQGEEQQASARQSRTDYRLAIKPSDNWNSPKGRGRAMTADSLQSADSAVRTKGIWERDGEGPTVASLPENVAPTQLKDNRGLWEKDEGAAGAPPMGALSAESQRRLTRSLGGFLDATNK